MNKTTHKTIFVDWYTTLSVTHYWEHLKFSDLRAYEQFSAFLMTNRELFNHWMRGQYATNLVAKQIATQTGYDAEFVRRELEKSCEILEIAKPELITELRRLRSDGHRVVLATDNILDFSRITVGAQGLDTIFDHILNSAEVGSLKTDREKDFFGPYLAQHGLDISQALLIDDSPQVEAVFANHPLRHIKVRSPDDTLAVLRAL